MKKVIILELILLLTLSVAATGAGVLADLKDQKFPADTKAYPGDIIRPQICPTDSNWVSFMIVVGFRTQLYITNTATLDERRITPRGDQNHEDDAVVQEVNDRDLAWRPVKSEDGKIWAAFISNAPGFESLYLYEINSNKYYSLRCWDDSLGLGRKMTPSWSPDGRCLSYTSTHSGDADIYVIRDMDDVLANPSDPKYSREPYHHSLVSDEGSQLGGIWCPAPGSGFLAYMHLSADENAQIYEVRIYDPRHERFYAFEKQETGMAYFAPSWSPSGRHLAYYQDQTPGSLLSGDLTMRYDSLSQEKFGLGVASIAYRKDNDSLVVTPNRGGKTKKLDIIDVAPNRGLPYAGPAWLSDGKHLLVSRFDEQEYHPLGIIATHHWIRKLQINLWLGSLAGVFNYPYPSDMSIVGDRVTFTFMQEQKRMLATATIELKSRSEPYEYLDITKERQKWWDNWSVGKRGGGLGVWLSGPVVGPNLGINTRGGLIGAGGAVLVYLLTKGGKGTVINGTERDWTPPGFPSLQKRHGGLSIKLAL
jgi:hypothetical protein